MTTLAVAAVGVAVWLMVPPAWTGPTRSQRAPTRVWVSVTLAAVTISVAAGGVAVPLRLLGWAAAAALTALILGSQIRARRRRASRISTRRAVAEQAEHLAGQLRAGIPVQRAVERVADEWAPMAPVAEAIRVGADVQRAFATAAAASDGARDLRLLGAAWQVASQTGQRLADVLDGAVDDVRARDRARAVVDGELASARATAQTVAVLPVLALAVGSGMGADPWGFLVLTPVGLGCLLAGLSLAWTGLVWIDRIAERVDQ